MFSILRIFVMSLALVGGLTLINYSASVQARKPLDEYVSRAEATYAKRDSVDRIIGTLDRIENKLDVIEDRLSRAGVQ